MGQFDRIAEMMTPPFLRLLGVETVSIESGRVVSRLPVREALHQQNGYVHAGAVGTLADHTAGAAAGTLLDDAHMPLTAEYKVNMLRPALGVALVCEATVLKAGRALTVAESEVFAEDEQGQRKLIAKATVTLAIVPVR
ncbi:PaaI family thioesterase [Alloalcanivorax gelatiniphagus]|uniref:Medium/long-chain acyl-CoA thioesterase YigI n=1 Tax=Alloalcanivorax gelatiniphagus TaxID=1194167 RepID=A0ABY2XMS6_9GAMM|nr:PaaI family thioesterase [Alloalcanivorax gelatiniphagus]TMW13003.1 PaaI family thioesterase [Alloalcanivorax gelatiniphagus]